jgi:hypothetical protein
MSIQIGAVGSSTTAAWQAQLQASPPAAPAIAANAAAEAQVATASAAMATGSTFSIMA